MKTFLLLLLAVCAMAIGCRNSQASVEQSALSRSPRPPLARANVEPSTAATPTPPPTVAATPPDDAWRSLAQQLEAENRQLVAERDWWKEEAERYQTGLGRAVDELNRVAGAARATEYRAALAAATPPPTSRVWTSLPWLQIVDVAAFVNGNIYNFGDAPATGKIEVDLLLNGAKIDTRAVPFSIAAGSSSTFSAQFPIRGGAVGTYAAAAHPVGWSSAP